MHILVPIPVPCELLTLVVYYKNLRVQSRACCKICSHFLGAFRRCTINIVTFVQSSDVVLVTIPVVTLPLAILYMLHDAKDLTGWMCVEIFSLS